MKTKCQQLLQQLENKLEPILPSIDEDINKYYPLVITYCLESLNDLRTIFLKSELNSEAEIRFFKQCKPQWTSKLIYFNERFKIQTNKPQASQKTIKKYYTSQLKKLEKFIKENAEFYKYYYSGHNYLDEHYFLRNKKNYNLNLDSYCFQNDTLFTTTHDYKVAQILANAQLQDYLLSQRKMLSNIRENATIKSLKWTGSKVGMIELIYALHTAGVFNNGASDLREIAKGFGSAFDIDIGQFHRTFYEISNRKSDRTKFLNTLKESLINRMDQADEF